MPTVAPGSPERLDSLRDWFKASARDLPWRQPGTTAWGVLVSEVMLQQTPVARVLPVYEQWLDRWPTPAALAADSAGAAVRRWGRLGYPRRALRLHSAAVACVERHGGEVPKAADELRALPGVGSYTAAAVAAFAFGTRIPVIDTNVRRVVARWSLGLPSALAIPDSAVAQLLPTKPEAAVITSAALMELGAVVCVSRSPRCDECPIAVDCRWIALGAPSAAEAGVRSRPAQSYEGTDRQVRGRLLAVVRDADRPVLASKLEPLWPDSVQRDRALTSLLDDGLMVEVSGGYSLPG